MTTSTPPMAAKKATFLADVNVAGSDLRKVCNFIKQTSSVHGAAVMTSHDPLVLAKTIANVSDHVAKRLGLMTAPVAAFVMPMVTEAVALIVADTARYGDGLDTLEKESTRIVDSIVQTIKLKTIDKIIETEFPSDMDSTFAVRISAAVALAQVATEIEGFDFYASSAECLKEAARVVSRGVMGTVAELTPRAASDADKAVFAQSMLRSAGNIYAAVWKREAKEVVQTIRDATPPQRAAIISSLTSGGYKATFQKIDQRFQVVMQTVADLSANIFDPVLYSTTKDGKKAEPILTVHSQADVAPATAPRRNRFGR